MTLPSAAMIPEFLKKVESRLGAPYIWPAPINGYSGKDIPNASYHGCYDCSGLVTTSLKDAGGPDWRATHNARKLYDLSLPIELADLRPGDLAFYGEPQKSPLTGYMISHVAVCMGGKSMIEAMGGTSQCLTPAIAKAIGASVREHHKLGPTWRKDFVRIGRIFQPAVQK